MEVWNCAEQGEELHDRANSPTFIITDMDTVRNRKIRKIKGKE